MNLQDVAAHWVALHEALGLGSPIASEAEYERAMAEVDQLVDATEGQDSHPLWGLIAVAGDRIRAYEACFHPWPDTSSPSAVLVSSPSE